MNNKLIVKEKFKGTKAVFATEPIKKGEIVLEWNPDNVYLSEEETRTIHEDEKRYVGIFNKRYVLIAEPGRYVNHSCDPNISNKDGKDYALRDIDVGEEITGNYEDGGTLLGFQCSCGAANCMKFIKGTI